MRSDTHDMILKFIKFISFNFWLMFHKCMGAVYAVNGFKKSLIYILDEVY